MTHPAQIPIDDLLKDCQIQRGRRSGPGGQHRNKTETAIFITHQPTGILAQATESRSQLENQKRAIRRLRTKLAIEHREPLGLLKYRPPEFLARRIHDRKLQLNSRHEEFPAVLAEVMDLIHALHGDTGKASLVLDLSTSQIVKLLKVEPAALERVNEMRKLHGDRLLK